MLEEQGGNHKAVVQALGIWEATGAICYGRDAGSGFPGGPVWCQVLQEAPGTGTCLATDESAKAAFMEHIIQGKREDAQENK